MSAATLQRSTVLSFLLHITLFGAALWAARHSNHFVMPSAYVVNLVAPQAATTAQAGLPKAPEKPVTEKSRTESRTVQESPKAKDRLNKEKDVSEIINAMRAKQAIEKKKELAEIVLKVGKGEGRPLPVIEAGRQGKGSNVENYTARIGEEIRQHWKFPVDLLKDKNIEAIISIRIQKNGSLQIIGIEKSSGNPLFDRSALTAITKASPVNQPPQEMEIGVRFYP